MELSQSGIMTTHTVTLVVIVVIVCAGATVEFFFLDLILRITLHYCHQVLTARFTFTHENPRE